MHFLALAARRCTAVRHPGSGLGSAHKGLLALLPPFQPSPTREVVFFAQKCNRFLSVLLHLSLPNTGKARASAASLASWPTCHLGLHLTFLSRQSVQFYLWPKVRYLNKAFDREETIWENGSRDNSRWLPDSFSMGEMCLNVLSRAPLPPGQWPAGRPPSPPPPTQDRR